MNDVYSAYKSYYSTRGTYELFIDRFLKVLNLDIPKNNTSLSTVLILKAALAVNFVFFLSSETYVHKQ